MERLTSRQVYENRWLSVREDLLRRAGGSTATYAVVDMADIALVVPVDGERLHLVEQYRYPVQGRRWEFPSGSADSEQDSDMIAVARRELREETGLTAGRLTRLGRLDVAPSTLGHRCHVFAATALSEGGPDRDDEEHDLRSARFTTTEVRDMIASGDVCDAKSVAAFALLVLHGVVDDGRR